MVIGDGFASQKVFVLIFVLIFFFKQEEFAPKTIIDFLWACLLNDSKAVRFLFFFFPSFLLLPFSLSLLLFRLVGETAFSFLPKALFFPVTEDLVEMAESPAALAKRVGLWLLLWLFCVFHLFSIFFFL